MRIAELPRLKAALDMMGMDSGADVISTAEIPDTWVMRARIAEDELLHLKPEQVVDLVMGEHTDQRKIAKFAPNADEFLAESFDAGELADIFFKPWRNIYDARAAELKHR